MLKLLFLTQFYYDVLMSSRPVNPYGESVLGPVIAELREYPRSLPSLMLNELASFMTRHTDVVLTPFDVRGVKILLPSWQMGRKKVPGPKNPEAVTEEEQPAKFMNVMQRVPSILLPPAELIGPTESGAQVGIYKPDPPERPRVVLLSRRMLRGADIARVARIENFFATRERPKRSAAHNTNTTVPSTSPPKPKTQKTSKAPTAQTKRKTKPAEAQKAKPATPEEKLDLSNLPKSLVMSPNQIKLFKLMSLPLAEVAIRVNKKYNLVKNELTNLQNRNHLSREQLLAFGVLYGKIDLSELPPPTSETLTDKEKLLLPVILQERTTMLAHTKIKLGTLRRLRPQLLRKLGTKDKQQAYLIGLRDGHIPLPGYTPKNYDQPD